MPHLLPRARSVAARAAVADGRLLVHPRGGGDDRRRGAQVGPAQVKVQRDGEDVVLFVDGDEAVEVGRLSFFNSGFFESDGWGEFLGPPPFSFFPSFLYFLSFPVLTMKRVVSTPGGGTPWPVKGLST